MKKVLLILSLLLILTSQALATGDSLRFFERRVIWRMGAVYDATIFDDTILDAFINQACYDLVTYVGSQARCVVKQDSVVLASGTVQYSLNSDHFRGLTVHPLSYGRQSLDHKPLSDWGKKPTGSLTDAVGFTFVDEIQRLLVDPKPTAVDTLLVFYNAYPNELTLDTMHSNIPREWSNAIIDLATAYCMERVQNEWSNYYRTLYDIEMRRLIMIFSQPPYNVIVAPQVIKR